MSRGPFTVSEGAVRARLLRLLRVALVGGAALGVVACAPTDDFSRPGRLTGRNEANIAYARGDFATAGDLWRRRAEQGDAEAALLLSGLYADGKGVERDYVLAAQWCAQAAEAGHLGAQNTLGLYFEMGSGVPKDLLEAARWYRKSAERGHPEAQSNIGNMYSRGDGVPQDQAEAVVWWRKAALQGQAAAQANLGAHLTTGDGGLVDSEEGLRWTRRAAEQGDVTGSFNLGVAYVRGLGVLADRIQAHLWFSVSLAQSTKRGVRVSAGGDAGSVSETDKFDRLRAESALAKVRKEMSDAERAEADRLFGNWRPT